MTTEQSEMQLLLKERGSTHNSIQMADEYLECVLFCQVMNRQASESHSLLINQRNKLSLNRGRIGGILTRFPVVNDLMKSIKNHKNRDNIIVAIFIAICIFFCIWYVSPRRS